MQKKEFKDFIKKADSKNDELQNSCEQMKKRFERKIEDVKAQYELFKQNYLTDDISEVREKYKRYVGARHRITGDGIFDWYIDFKTKQIVHSHKSGAWDLERVINDNIEWYLNKSFEQLGGANLKILKERLLKIELVMQKANEQITDIFDVIKDRIEDGLQADADKFNSVTFDDDDTEQVIKKYKVTINIEEV